MHYEDLFWIISLFLQQCLVLVAWWRVVYVVAEASPGLKTPRLISGPGQYITGGGKKKYFLTCVIINKFTISHLQRVPCITDVFSDALTMYSVFPPYKRRIY